jgi:hypothetical protein
MEHYRRLLRLEALFDKLGKHRQADMINRSIRKAMPGFEDEGYPHPEDDFGVQPTILNQISGAENEVIERIVRLSVMFAENAFRFVDTLTQKPRKRRRSPEEILGVAILLPEWRSLSSGFRNSLQSIEEIQKTNSSGHLSEIIEYDILKYFFEHPDGIYEEQEWVDVAEQIAMSQQGYINYILQGN